MKKRGKKRSKRKKKRKAKAKKARVKVRRVKPKSKPMVKVMKKPKANKAKKEIISLNRKKFWIFVVIIFVIGMIIGVAFFGPFVGYSGENEIIPVKCSDSDSGFNIETRGLCHDIHGTHIDGCVMKAEEIFLREYECVENRCVSQEVSCEEYSPISGNTYQACYFGVCPTE
jgi:hypothetical protein